jgi:Protein  of unknown function (DUF3018)
MTRHSKSTSSRAKVAAHRARLRAPGLRPIEIWVPDVRSPEFKAEAARQAHLVARDPHEAETMAFIEAAADWDGEE